MAENRAPLNGNGNQEVWVHSRYIGPQGNESVYYGEVRYYGNGWGSWDSSSTFYWYATFGIASIGGAWNIPFANRNDAYTVLWAGNFAIPHDGEGYRGAFTISAAIDTNHTSIGDGSVSAVEPGPPRIPKAPTVARNVRLARAEPTALTIAWDAPVDDRGSAISQYVARINVRSPADAPPYTDIVTGPDGRSATFTGLKPGTTYYAVVYPRNAVGYAPKSAQIAPRTISGAYLRYGNQWVPVEVLVYTSSGWQSAEVLTYTTSGWQRAL